MLAVLIALGVGMRLSVVQFGRELQVLNLDENPPHLLQPSTLRQRMQQGDLSVKSGQQILDLFRSQVPVNPFIHSQIDESNLRSDQTYLITTHRRLQRDIQLSLGNRVSFYRNEEGILFDGHHPPDVFVFQSPLPRDRVLDQPLMDVQYPEGTAQVPYLWLPSVRSMQMFFTGDPPPISVNLVLSGARDIPPEFLNRVNTVYVAGQNARFLDPEDRVTNVPLILVNSAAEVPYAGGMIDLPGPGLYLAGLMVLGLGVMIYGAGSDTHRWTWLVWTSLFIGTALLIKMRQPVMVGLLSAGLIRLGWVQTTRRAAWFLMAGLLAFGGGFVPYRLDPLVGREYVLIGLILGSITMLPVLDSWWGRTMKNRDLALSMVSVGFIGGVLWFDSYPYESIPLLKALLLTGLPLLSRLGTRVTESRSWTWLVGTIGWTILLVNQPSSVTWIGFALSLLVWEWERKIPTVLPFDARLPWRGKS